MSTGLPVDPGKNIAVRLPQAPVRRDPDRDRKFADLLRVLRATCEAFAEPPRPLAIGIDKQVSALAGGQFERPVIGWVLRWWTGRPDYLQALADGAVRINLDGTPAGESSEKDRASAAHRLAERQQRKENERAARKRIIG